MGLAGPGQSERAELDEADRSIEEVHGHQRELGRPVPDGPAAVALLGQQRHQHQAARVGLELLPRRRLLVEVSAHQVGDLVGHHEALHVVEEHDGQLLVVRGLRNGRRRGHRRAARGVGEQRPGEIRRGLQRHRVARLDPAQGLVVEQLRVRQRRRGPGGQLGDVEEVAEQAVLEEHHLAASARLLDDAGVDVAAGERREPGRGQARHVERIELALHQVERDQHRAMQRRMLEVAGTGIARAGQLLERRARVVAQAHVDRQAPVFALLVGRDEVANPVGLWRAGIPHRALPQDQRTILDPARRASIPTIVGDGIGRRWRRSGRPGRRGLCRRLKSWELAARAPTRRRGPTR